jgi:uncharacterized membrane protein
MAVRTMSEQHDLREQHDLHDHAIDDAAGGAADSMGQRAAFAMSAPGRWDASRVADPKRLEELDYEMRGISPRRRAFSAAITRGLHGAGGWLEKHWLGVVNGVLGTYVGVAVATPIAFMLGQTGPASAVFRFYRIFCDELPTHSLFIGGYQICLCARCLAIYTTMLIVGLALNFWRNRRAVVGIPWWLWFLAAGPMALDGLTQMFGARESNLALRLLTGCIFGLATALYVLPQLDAATRPRAVSDGALAEARVGG